MRGLRWFLLAPILFLVALVVTPIKSWLAPAGVVTPRASASASAAEMRAVPAVLLLDADRAGSVAVDLAAHHRVYSVPRWRAPDPERLARIVAALDEDQIVLVGPSQEHLRVAALPPGSPAVVGNIALARSQGEIEWAVRRAGDRARNVMTMERELYHVVRMPGARTRTGG